MGGACPLFLAHFLSKKKPKRKHLSKEKPEQKHLSKKKPKRKHLSKEKPKRKHLSKKKWHLGKIGLKHIVTSHNTFDR